MAGKCDCPHRRLGDSGERAPRGLCEQPAEMARPGRRGHAPPGPGAGTRRGTFQSNQAKPLRSAAKGDLGWGQTPPSGPLACGRRAGGPAGLEGSISEAAHRERTRNSHWNGGTAGTRRDEGVLVKRVSTLTHFTTLPFLTHSPETVNHTRGSLAGWRRRRRRLARGCLGSGGLECPRRAALRA